jgi:hypothetical protein
VVLPAKKHRFSRWALGIPFVALPVFPEFFALVAVVIALYLWLVVREKPLWLGFFVAQAVLWSSAHWFAGQQADPAPTPQAGEAEAVQNLIPAHGWADLHGWNSQDHAGPWAVRQPDGFWRVERRHPASGRPFVEILSGQLYPVSAGNAYTLSLLFRHDGRQVSFDFSFYIPGAHQPVPARIVDLGGGLYRAYASYHPPQDQRIRAPSLVNLEGDWNYLEIGYIQLEPGPVAHAYVPFRPPEQNWLNGLGWATGTPLLAMAVLQSGRFLLAALGPARVAWYLLAGLAVHAAYGVFQYLSHPASSQVSQVRVAGHDPNPNTFGHTGLAVALLIVLLAGFRLGVWAAAVSGLMVFLSGSRTALVGWMALMATVGVGLAGRLKVYPLVPVALIAALLLWSQGHRLNELVVNLTDQTRWVIYATLWQAFISHPWSGVGIGSVPAYFLLNRPPETLEIFIPHAHNAYLQLLVELGLLGFIGLVLVLYKIAEVVWKARAWRAALAMGIILSLNLFDNTLFYAGVYYSLWLMAVAVLIQPDRMTR